MFAGTKRQFFSVFLVVSLIVSSFLPLPFEKVSAEEESYLLKVLHTNDIHSSIDGLGKAAAYMEAERAEADFSLYLDAGDVFSGNPVVDLQEGEPIIRILNEMNLDAMVIGNHEFDYGQEAFARNVELANFPWLSANTEVVDSEIPIEQPEPYFIQEMDGFTVGILALTQTPPATAPAGIVGLEFHPYAETVEEYAYIRDEVDVLIGLTHIGYGADRELAEQFDEFFDVIIGGHTHTVLQEPVVVNGTPIVQTGANLSNIGNLSIEIDADTMDVINVEGFLQPVDELTETNAEIQAMIDEYNAEMDEVLAQVIGYTETGLSRDERYEQDAPLGNFWTDAMREYVQADMAFTNNGGIRANIEPGEITAGDIYTVEPFANEVMEMEMTGAAIRDVIEYSYNRRNQIDLQTSGLHYTIFTDEEGNLVDVELVLNGEPLDMGEKYRVAVSDYTATGGGGYDFVGEVIQPSAGFMTNAMIDFAQSITAAGEYINYESEGRISVELYEEEAEEAPPQPGPPAHAGPPAHSGAPAHAGPPAHAGKNGNSGRE